MIHKLEEMVSESCYNEIVKKLKEYVRQTADYFNKDAAIVYGDDPKPFISLRPSVEKLEKDTGWSPQIDFKRSLKWYT